MNKKQICISKFQLYSVADPEHHFGMKEFTKYFKLLNFFFAHAPKNFPGGGWNSKIFKSYLFFHSHVLTFHEKCNFFTFPSIAGGNFPSTIVTKKLLYFPEFYSEDSVILHWKNVKSQFLKLSDNIHLISHHRADTFGIRLSGWARK